MICSIHWERGFCTEHLCSQPERQRPGAFPVELGVLRNIRHNHGRQYCGAVYFCLLHPVRGLLRQLGLSCAGLLALVPQRVAVAVLFGCYLRNGVYRLCWIRYHQRAKESP